MAQNDKALLLLVEDIASRIYNDWNKSSEYEWNSLPEYRRQAYRDWVNEFVISKVRPLIEQARKEADKDHG